MLIFFASFSRLLPMHDYDFTQGASRSPLPHGSPFMFLLIDWPFPHFSVLAIPWGWPFRDHVPISAPNSHEKAKGQVVAACEQWLIFVLEEQFSLEENCVKTSQLTCQEARANISNTELPSATLMSHEILSLLAQWKFPCPNSLRSSYKLGPLLEFHKACSYSKSYEGFYSKGILLDFIQSKVSQLFEHRIFFFSPKHLLHQLTTESSLRITATE